MVICIIICSFQIFTCITENLIPSFENSPLDVETLRVYLTLPLYHGFTNPLNFSTLQNPFSKAMFGLKIEARNVVTSWWHTAPTYYFEKLVRIYKSIILHFVKQAEDKVNYVSRDHVHNIYGNVILKNLSYSLLDGM